MQSPSASLRTVVPPQASAPAKHILEYLHHRSGRVVYKSSIAERTDYLWWQSAWRQHVSIRKSIPVDDPRPNYTAERQRYRRVSPSRALELVQATVDPGHERDGRVILAGDAPGSIGRRTANAASTSAGP